MKPLTDVTCSSSSCSMELEPGKLAFFAVVASHLWRSWVSYESPDLIVLKSELANFRSEVLRAEHTLPLTNQA